MKVLIAEDDDISRAILSATMNAWGWEPIVTRDGTAAWDALQRTDAPRLVLLDWEMPGMDGIEICRRLQALHTIDPPYVILLTARERTVDIVTGLAAGANDYIAKPYESAELRARLEVGRRTLELQSSLVEARAAQEQLAMRDSLTDVWTRRAILDTLREELSRARRTRGALTVGLCDVDHFKLINDTHGHGVGDDVLVAFTQRLQANLRDYDRLGRYGGEEFLVVAAPTQGHTMDGVYERLRACIADSPVVTPAGPISVTVSIGVATASGHEDLYPLIAVADAALYEAKARGRNCVVHRDARVILEEAA
jgi:two-component system, cell cycle response regulator